MEPHLQKLFTKNQPIAFTYDLLYYYAHPYENQDINHTTQKI